MKHGSFPLFVVLFLVSHIFSLIFYRRRISYKNLWSKYNEKTLVKLIICLIFIKECVPHFISIDWRQHALSTIPNRLSKKYIYETFMWFEYKRIVARHLLYLKLTFRCTISISICYYTNFGNQDQRSICFWHRSIW